MAFTVEISVTEKCNLGCPYCYVANKSTFMTKEAFDEGLNQIHKFMEMSGDNEYKISFFGGEPLLNWDLIQYATPILKNDPKNIGVNIISNLTLIDEEKVQWINENNIGVSWSFDGITSNDTRPLLPISENNDPQTGKLYNNILELYEHKKDIIKSLTNGCKVMIWPGNVKDMTENFEFLLEWGIDHPDFSLVRDDIWTIDDIKTYEKELKRLTDTYISKIKNGKFCSIGLIKLNILDTLYGLIKGKRPFGCFAGTHGAALLPNGKFYPCARFASKEIMQIDETFDFNYYQNQFNPNSFDKCQTCNLKQVCNAGCTYSQLLNSNKPIDSICELYHISYMNAHRVIEELKDEPTFHKVVKMWLDNIG